MFGHCPSVSLCILYLLVGSILIKKKKYNWHDILTQHLFYFLKYKKQISYTSFDSYQMNVHKYIYFSLFNKDLHLQLQSGTPFIVFLGKQIPLKIHKSVLFQVLESRCACRTKKFPLQALAIWMNQLLRIYKSNWTPVFIGFFSWVQHDGSVETEQFTYVVSGNSLREYSVFLL